MSEKDLDMAILEANCDADRSDKDCIKCGMAQGEAHAKAYKPLHESRERLLAALHEILPHVEPDSAAADLIRTALDREDPHGKWSHDNCGRPHSGKRGHYCLEWDGLWICEDCDEFECCRCGFGEGAL